MDLKRLMLGTMLGLMEGLATAAKPAYGTMANDDRLVPKKNMEKLAQGSSIMAMAAVGKANPSAMIEIIQFDIT